MKLHILRNATLIIHVGDQRILVDPMLGPKGCLPPFALVRHPRRRNPLIDLPENAAAALDEVTAVVITHRHGDHLDAAGIDWLAARQLPVFCAPWDAAKLAAHQLNVTALPLGRASDFFGGTIRPIPTQHGHGLVGRLMGKGVGYLIVLLDEPPLYLSGDTVLTPVVQQVLVDLDPAVAVVAAGAASLDIGKPILMTELEVLKFIELAPGIVVANHLEALNHCPTTRAGLLEAAEAWNVQDKVRIPADGDILEF